MNRRQAIKTVIASGISLIVLDESLTGAASPLLSTLRISLQDSRFVALQQVNGTVEITNAVVPGIQGLMPSFYPLALVRVDSTTVSALAKECPHNQCQVGKYNGVKFVCPCHGSEFNAKGERLAGPTPGPLISYPTSLEGDVLTVLNLPGDQNWNLTSADDLSAPTAIALFDNSPNPFQEMTEIGYILGSAATVKLEVFDSVGKLVLTLVNSFQQPGRHTVRFDANGLPAGVYHYTMRVGHFVETKRMQLIR